MFERSSYVLVNLLSVVVLCWAVWAFVLRAPTPPGGAFEAQPSFGEIENACRLIEARPHWWRALNAAERRWAVPPHLTLAIMWRESSFRADARPMAPRLYGYLPPQRLSSAYGYAQALDGTWDWYLRETERVGARREAFADAADFIGWYLDRSRRQLGLSFEEPFDHYAAYHQGHGGYLRADWRENPVVTVPARDVDRRAQLYAGQMQGCVKGYAARQAPQQAPAPRPRPQSALALKD